MNLKCDTCDWTGLEAALPVDVHEWDADGFCPQCGKQSLYEPKISDLPVANSSSPEYRAFHGAMNRCLDKSDPHYGGRGIEFRFKSLDEFVAELGRRPSPKHSLDRIDNDGNYESGNVRWATKITQNRNQRKTRYVTALGKTQCVSEWAKELGYNDSLIRDRLRSARYGASGRGLRRCPHANGPVIPDRDPVNLQLEEKVSFDDRRPMLAATLGLAFIVMGMLGFAVLLTAVEASK